MCFFCGLIEVLREAGVMRLFARLLRPFLALFFPGVYKSGEGAEEICGNLAANLLGAGNAATPGNGKACAKQSGTRSCHQRYGDACGAQYRVTFTSSDHSHCIAAKSGCNGSLFAGAAHMDLFRGICAFFVASDDALGQMGKAAPGLSDAYARTEAP